MNPKNDVVVDAVYETSDYKQFKFLEQNREIDKNRVEKLVSSMQEKLIKTEILVNERYEIIDGQHRFCALKKLGLPIRYVIEPKTGIDDCRRMNQYNKSWAYEDWIISWSRCDDAEIALQYQNLLDCKKETKLPIYRILRLCNIKTHNEIKSCGRTEFESKIRSGKLKFSTENMDEVYKIVAMAKEIVDALQFGHKLNDAFWVAVKVICEYEGYNHRHMVNNCEAYRASYAQAANLEMQLKEFSRIYNKKISRDRQLHFEDYMRNRGYNVRNYDHNGGRKII